MVRSPFVIGGLLEESGWRGYALPQLQPRMGALWASIILGVIHACWHLPLFFIPGAGFDVVPTDCLAAILGERMRDATDLALAFFTKGSELSRGTKKTMLAAAIATVAANSANTPYWS